MTTVVIATPDAVLVARHEETWTVEAHLAGMKAQALAVDERGERLYVGTSGKGLFRSVDGGRGWEKVSFPHDNITAVAVQGNVRSRHGVLYVSIEAGALLRAKNGGETWRDRAPDGPYDTHTAATHHDAAGRVYSAAGDGYYESADGGESWTRRMEGLAHRYLVGVAAE